jgi:toxin-antitoxin system PIN domain toxin
LILPDVNVLLYAFRADSDNHARYRRWLHDAIAADEPYGMSPQALASLVRICTNPRIFRKPTPLSEALAFASTLLKQSNCYAVTPGTRHWSIFERLCTRVGARGNLVQDAWFAALAIESGSEWITTDRDYAQFEGLRWRRPLD